MLYYYTVFFVTFESMLTILAGMKGNGDIFTKGTISILIHLPFYGRVLGWW